MIVTMKEILAEASKGNYAVAAPNVTGQLDASAYIAAAEELRAPLIFDVGEMPGPHSDPMSYVVPIVRGLAEKASVPIAINLDHGHDLGQVYRAIQAGVTSVMLDRSSCPFEKNVADVKEVVDIAKLVGISVEAELGHVGQAESYDNDRNASLTQPKEAVEFIERTGVDCLAVAIGTAHGLYPKGLKPYLDYQRLAEIKEATNHFPLVLHGASGTADEDLAKVCSMGINKVNIFGDLCKAMAAALKSADLEGNHAYEVLSVAKYAAHDHLAKMIRICGSDGKVQ